MDNVTLAAADLFNGFAPEQCNGTWILKSKIPNGQNGETELWGQTSFFRYPGPMRKIIKHFMQGPKDQPLRFLFAPCSVGCEPYTFVALALEMGFFDYHPRAQIHAFDLSPEFTAFGKNAIFPSSLFSGESIKNASLLLPSNTRLRDVFSDADNKDHTTFVTLDEAVRARVQFLEPQALESFQTDQPYDFVMTMNLFIHINGNDNIQAITNSIASVCDGLFVTNYNGNARTPDGYKFMREQKFARIALAQSGFLMVDDKNFEPIIELPARDILPEWYPTRCDNTIGNAVFLRSSDTKPKTGLLDVIARPLNQLIVHAYTR